MRVEYLPIFIRDETNKWDEYHKLFDALMHNDKENNKYILQS